MSAWQTFQYLLDAANASYLAVAGAILVFAFALTRSIAASARGRSVLRRINCADVAFYRAVVALVVAYFLVYSYLSVHRYHKFLCGTWDLGIFESLFQNVLSGGGYRDYRGPFDHFQPAGVVFLPFYALWNDGRMLLVLQTAALTAAAWPLYLAAREASGSRVMASTVVIAYLLYPFLGSANLYDFHILCLSPFFFFWMLYWMLKRRWGLYALFMLGLLMVKESEAILVFGVGLYLVTRKEWSAGALTVAAALLWGYLSIFVMLPAVTGEAFRHMDRYQGLAGAANWSLSTRAARWTAAAHVLRWGAIMAALLAPMGFLAARRVGAAACLIGPMYAANMLSRVNLQNAFFGHYGLTATSAALGAAALATAGLRGSFADERPSAWPAFVVIVAILSNVAFSHPADRRWWSPAADFDAGKSWNVMSMPIPFTKERADFYKPTSDADLLLAVRDFFPKGAVIAAQNSLGYQLAGRYMLKDLTGSVEADYYIMCPDFQDAFERPNEIKLLLERLRQSGARCFLSVNAPGAGAADWFFYAEPSKAVEFYDNIARAASANPGNDQLARAVRAMNRTMGLDATGR